MTLVVRPGSPARVVVLASGGGTLLQSMLDAAVDPAYPARVVAVGSDVSDSPALTRAEAAGVPRFTVSPRENPDRDSWDRALADAVTTYAPDLIVLAGFMRLVGSSFLDRFGDRTLNCHPALLPAFPGAHAVRDALAYGARIAGTSLIFVDGGVDSGPIVAQEAVPVLPGDDEATLHERIKVVERSLLVGQVARLAKSGWTIDERRVSVP